MYVCSTSLWPSVALVWALLGIAACMQGGDWCMQPRRWHPQAGVLAVCIRTYMPPDVNAA